MFKGHIHFVHSSVQIWLRLRRLYIYWKYLDNNREKSLCPVAMVTKKFLDDKPKASKWILTVSNFINLFHFQLFCQMLATFSFSKFTTRKGNFCVVFMNSIEWARGIRKFIWQSCKDGQEMYKKAWWTSRVVVLPIKTYCFLAVLVAAAAAIVCRCLSSLFL